MKYENPVSVSGFSDPDVIRAGDDFYMAVSSFNMSPGIPVYRSRNLADWEPVNHVLPRLPFEKFGEVCRDDGAVSPSLAYRNGKFYCLASFPGEGIFVAEADDPCGKWSLLRPLLSGKGFIDPCPVWAHGKCFVVFAFDKNLSGVDSRLAVFETDEELKTPATKYAYVYDGGDWAPLVRNPKFYRRGDNFYILAAAGGRKAGWQIALRSEKIYGPYTGKIIFMQGDGSLSGPCGGSLVDLGEGFAYVHSAYMGAYGPSLCVQPVEWADGWPIPGERKGQFGQPVLSWECPALPASEGGGDPGDEFEGERLSPKWQTPANLRSGVYSLKNGLRLNCVEYGGKQLFGLPQIFMQNLPYLNFSVKCKCRLNLLNDGDEAGFTVFGEEYSYICVVRSGGRNYLEIREGGKGKEEDETLCRSQPYDENYVTFQISAKHEEPFGIAVKYTFGGSAFTRKFYPSPLCGGGAKLGLYARSAGPSQGSVTFKFFRVTCTDNRVSVK